MANFAAVDLDGLVRIVKRELKKIASSRRCSAWLRLIGGCLTGPA